MKRYTVQSEGRTFVVYAKTSREAYARFRAAKIVDRMSWAECTPDKSPANSGTVVDNRKAPGA